MPTLIATIEMTDQPPLTAGDLLTPAQRRRFKTGDLDALGEVYSAYTGPVHTVVRGILGAGGQAHDAVQETFMRAWRGAASFDAERPMGPWLFTIARRTSIEVIQRETRPTRSDHDELTDDVSIDLPGMEEAWERWEIRVALERLPEDERTVLLLSHFQGLTHPEIAERLAIPTGTVRSRSHRAHRRLSGLLKHLVDSGYEEVTDV